MLERIKILRNIGQFDSVNPNQQTAISKITLIYAENGRGKTTIANILRSLGTNDPELIKERHRLGTQNNPQIVLDLNNQTYTFQNGNWSSTFRDIIVFDEHFVARNVCSGISIETSHKQNLHEFILGAKGVALNNKLKNCISRIERHNHALKSKKAAIPINEGDRISIDEFCALSENPNVEKEITELERNLAAMQDAEQIKKQPKFAHISLLEINTRSIELLLQSDLPGLQTTATSRVRQHLKNLGKNSEDWVSEGMKKILTSPDGEVCPFCIQELDQSSIIEHYKAYFSQEYTSLKQKISDIGKSFNVSHGAEVQSSFERDMSSVIQIKEFWQNYLLIPDIQIDTKEVAFAWNLAKESVLRVLRAKFVSPLEKMKLSQEALDKIKTFNYQRRIVAEYSQSLVNINEQIEAVKEKSNFDNLESLNEELRMLELCRKRYNPKISQYCESYINEKKAKNDTEILRDKARKELDEYRKNIFKDFNNAINSYLLKFNAGFRLTRLSSQNHRSGSSCTYSVYINKVDVPLQAKNARPSFKNTLSSGDRNTLALAFFFASLEKDQTQAQKIVVIDDPITSLDEHRSLATIQEIRNLTERVKQLIVLSHSKLFLCQFWEGTDKTILSALKIIRKGQSSEIEPWFVHQDCITEHDKRHELIKNYIEQEEYGNKNGIAISLRFVLESFLRVAYPDKFPPGKLLGQFYNDCKQAKANNTSILKEKDLNEFSELVDYVNKFHHDKNSVHSLLTINDQELLSYCRRVLAFTRRSLNGN